VLIIDRPTAEKKDPYDDATARERLPETGLSQAWSELEADATDGGVDESQLLKRYIRLCPFVDGRGSAAVAAAVEGVERAEPKKRGDLSSSAKKVAKQCNNQGESVATELHMNPTNAPLLKIARFAFLDFPVVFFLVVHYAFNWTAYVHENYVHDQLNAMVFSSTRMSEESTYYARKCSPDDITTQNGNDLFLSPQATVDEAYEHQLLHGFSVFRSVLSEDTMGELRQHIVKRNGELLDRESIYVIENENRFSFGLGTEEPSVTKAMKEIANHEQLRPSLEKVLGPNPALIEMTAITSTYGAIDQYYHDDVIPTGSAIRYARTFGPSYSVFVQLQNTTKAMGATGACPGTHYCSAGPIDELCENEGFQMVGDDGYWRAGDALLMNMNSYHRGSAHTDPDALDRVMLILTFSPRPNKRAESRQMSQGITFSLRWDMWGHTLFDLEEADARMVHPWALMRALGLYKRPDAEWGVDFITGSSMRIANGDYGYKPDELDDFIDAGGIYWLPKFLQGTKELETDSWYEYLQDTFFKCQDFAELVFRCVVGAYIAFFAPMIMVKSQRKVACNAYARLVLYWTVLYYLYSVAKRYVGTTEWAADVKAGRRYANFFKNQTAFGIKEPGPTTLPNQKDVLIETRFGSEYLHLYEDYINGHPGNRYFLDLVREGAKAYASYPDFLKDASVRYIISSVAFNQGRFLYQGAGGRWHWISDQREELYTKRLLEAYSNGCKGMTTKNIRRLQSEYMYGVHRQTIMAQKHSVPFLRKLDEKILGGVPDPVTADIPDDFEEESDLEPEARATLKTFSFIPKLPVRDARYMPRTSTNFPEFDPEEPEENAWIIAGETVEHLNDEFWYAAKLDWIDALGDCQVSYSNGETSPATLESIRTYEDYHVGEEDIEVVGEDE